MTAPRPRHVLAVASAGGHFNQLILLGPAFNTHTVSYMTTRAGLAEQFGLPTAGRLPDCNARTPLRALACAMVALSHALRLRPDVIITTGALPGLLMLTAGRAIGARTLWIDSVANAEDLSASGRLARRIAHLTLSQWPGVAATTGTGHEGSIL